MNRSPAMGTPRSNLASSLVALARYPLMVSLLGSVLAACGDDEVVAPADGAGGAGTTSASLSSGPSASTGASSSQSGSTGSGPVLRTVFERNPFGSQVENLLADGDFELSFGFAGQQGWTTYTPQGAQESLIAETGGICHSGLRCAKVPPGSLLLARGTSAANEWDMKATIWVKPVDSPSCVGVSAQAVGCDSFSLRATLIGTGGVNDEGWCSLSAVVQGSKIATCLFVDNSADQAMIFDDASLVALPPDPALRPLPLSPPQALSPEARARMERVRDRVRDTLPLGPPPILPPGAKPLPGRSYTDPPDLGP